MTRIGIYGGTFSPPHKGHVAAARAFMEQMELDFLYVIPNALPPHKEMEAPVSAQHRLNMTRLAFGGIEGVYVSDMEIQRGGKSYTVDTLRTLSSSVGYLKSICGIGGIMFIILLVLPTLITLLLTRAVFILAVAVADLVGCENESKLLSELGSVYGVLVAVISMCSVMFILALTIFVRCTVALG